MPELMDEIVRLQNCRRNTHKRADKHPASRTDVPFEDEENGQSKRRRKQHILRHAINGKFLPRRHWIPL